MPEVVTSSAAESDLLEIFLYTGRQDRSPEGAERLLRAIDDACQGYARNPMTGTARPDLGEDFRVFSCGTEANPRGWVVVFRPHANGIELIRVFRAGRDYPNLL